MNTKKEFVPNMFGSKVFNDSIMKTKLPKETYKSLKRSIAKGKHLEPDVANVVASAMKDWAIEQGATHYTHWFQPMTGITAEKHDSFISPTEDGNIIMEFSGKELVKGEPDASSFPSGGLRATFEARGYTAWDPTSFAFIKDNTLCIPTAFCSYTGDALDKKTPLLRSMEAVDKQALRILRLFGNEDVKRVIATVGSEQEYFLIDESVFEKRPDLIYTGRTLVGSRPPKGQEMDDHYFGALKPRVSAFMKELDEELWKLGVLAKTEHNEAAPAQHELAPIYSSANVATDHNQLTMEMMKTIAKKHGMACLLHEKPFQSVNGSGKHNNWSLSTDTGVNLFEPGKTPSDNAQFLLFVTAVIVAVDRHQDLLRVSVATAGNDHRLGANEAPPAIVSLFLGDELAAIMDSIENDSDYTDKKKKAMEIGVSILPTIPQDTTDRNRTSPFAFTGNKFELRMPGSNFSISGPNIMLNTAVADVLDEFANILENGTNLNEDLNNLIRDNIRKHKRIIFNGDGYSDEWVAEAENRGLLNLKSTVDALPCYLDQKNIDLFAKHGVFTATELQSRYEILLENYCKTVNIEALTLIDMVRKDITPAVIKFQKNIADTANSKVSLGIGLSIETEKQILDNVSAHTDSMTAKVVELENAAVNVRAIDDLLESAKYYHDVILVLMDDLRKSIDALEMMVGNELWPYPSYGQILYSIK